MEKVVYLLGAGFSAPMGIPVMTDFLNRARDMARDDPTRFEHFREIFSKINEFHATKNYFKADLFNIEEVLSILEMRSDLGGEDYAQIFRDFIADVIEYHTRQIPEMAAPPGSNWYQFVFGRDTRWNQYGCFLANLINLRIGKSDNDSFDIASVPGPLASYSIITLNYDMILEMAYDFIRSRNFIPISNEPVSKLQINKLHGSVKGRVIIPPTYNKSSVHQVKEVWKSAKKLLQQANYLRIMGYSLPESDNHVRYLLKSSIEDADNLRKIDVICRDKSGEVKQRYDDFFEPGPYSFVQGHVEDYLARLFQLQLMDFMRTKKINPTDTLIRYGYNSLERAHGEFMAGVAP